MRQGDRVRLAGYPDRYPWMETLSEETGRIEEVNRVRDEVPVYGVRFAGVSDLLWFGASYLEATKREAA